MRAATLLLAMATLLASCAGTPRPEPLAFEAPPALDAAACRALDPQAAGVADVVVAIDTSHSTSAPSGADIDGDGRVGELRKSRLTDPDDTLLAAQIAGVRELLRSAAGPALSFAIVGFSGNDVPPWRPSLTRTVRPTEAALRSDLSPDLPALESVLDRMLARGGRGHTNFSAGMRQALRAHTESRFGHSAARRLVLFLSDSPSPVLIAPNVGFLRSDPGMARAAREAIESRVVIHTFGLGEAAATEPPHALSRIAGATGGTYRAVTDPAQLHCALLAALVQ